MSGIIKEIANGDFAKKSLIKGVNLVCDTVTSTMGARGRLVAIEKDGGKIESTKDGYATMRSLFFDDPHQSMAAELLKEASERTMALAGDNTTLTALLAQAFINESYKLVQQGKSPIDIKIAIEKSRDLVIGFLEKNCISEIDNLTIYNVAKTSANGDIDIAKLVTDAFVAVGENGSVTHFRSNTDETTLEYIKGSLLESGFADELFINTPADRTCVLENNPLIVISEINFKTNQQILPFLEYAVKNDREIVFISDMEFHVKTMILKNTLEKKLKALIIPPPSFGQKRRDFLNDLALVCNTQTISTLSGEKFDGRIAEFLGEAKSVLSSKSDTIITPSENLNCEAVEGKIAELKDNALKAPSQLEKKYIQDRVSKLDGGISILKIGGIVEADLNEKLDRVEDSIMAVRSAKEEGVVPGGGVALADAYFQISDLDEVTKNVLLAPMTKILNNAGIDPNFIKDSNWDLLLCAIGLIKSPVVNQYQLSQGIGYDVREFKVVDMNEAGILDTVKAIREAYSNAVSVANTILLTDYTITQKRNPNGE